MKNRIANFLRNVINTCINDKDDFVYYEELGDGLYLVVGWQDGFDDTDDLSDGNYHLCYKIAYNCDDLQCSYEYDWYMPYFVDDTLCDTETPLYSNANVDVLANDIVNDYLHMQDLLNKGELKLGEN